ncbi:ribonuclease H-like domain-containing protein, partial [Tanacetum coccineum]
KYVVEILERAHMVNCNPSETPVDTESKLGDDGDPVSDPTLYRSLAGSLQYPTFTRPDISYAVQQMRIGLVVLLLGDRLLVTVSFLATTYSLGPLSVSLRFLTPVLRFGSAGQVQVLHVHSRYQYADIFTKGLPSALFEEFRTSLTVWCPPPPNAWEC